jgi:hypothetical protein
VRVRCGRGDARRRDAAAFSLQARSGVLSPGSPLHCPSPVRAPATNSEVKYSPGLLVVKFLSRCDLKGPLRVAVLQRSTREERRFPDMQAKNLRTGLAAICMRGQNRPGVVASKEQRTGGSPASLRKKACRDCRLEKPLSEFYVKERRRSSVRRFSRCKPCYIAWVHRSVPSGVPRVVHDYATRRMQRRAWSLLGTAVYKGRIEKPSSCASCGRNFDRDKIEGHHEDYSKPYDVKWLCARCHRAVHAETR